MIQGGFLSVVGIVVFLTPFGGAGMSDKGLTVVPLPWGTKYLEK